MTNTDSPAPPYPLHSLSSTLPHNTYAYSSVTIDVTCCSYGLLSVVHCLKVGSDKPSLIRSLIHPNHLRQCLGHEHSLITSLLTTATSPAALSPHSFPSIKILRPQMPSSLGGGGVIYCSDSEVHLKPRSTNQI